MLGCRSISPMCTRMARRGRDTVRNQCMRTRGFCLPSHRLFPPQEELILVQTQTFGGAAGSSGELGAVAEWQYWGARGTGAGAAHPGVGAEVQAAGGGTFPTSGPGAPMAGAFRLLRNAGAGWR